MALGDLKQPANLWLADVVEEMGKQLVAEQEPVIELHLCGAKLEIRLNELPGIYSGKADEK